MNSVAQVLSQKRHTGVVTVRASHSVLEAARAMNDHRIGSVVVLHDHSDHVAGILTERDVLTRIVAVGVDPRMTRVDDAMTVPVQFCSPKTDVDELRALMTTQRIRHVPVIEEGELCGMVSIGDLNAFESGKLAQTVECLEAYITRG